MNKRTKNIPLNVLELVSVSEGQTIKEALDQSLEAAQLIDKLGFKRLWFAEHHNTISMASMATSNLIVFHPHKCGVWIRLAVAVALPQYFVNSH